MESLKRLRDAAAEVAAKRLGKDIKQPRKMKAQMSAQEYFSLIVSLPVDYSQWTRLQDPDTGELYYMAGLGILGTDPLGG